MLKQLRHKIINNLWDSYRSNSSQIQVIESKLRHNGVHHLPLDHFALIDLPGPRTGIPVLRELFETLGFVAEGSGYLPEKQNDFLWLREQDSIGQSVASVLPQAVVADFRLDEMTPAVRAIIEKYSQQASPLPLDYIQTRLHEPSTHTHITELITDYLAGRDWPLPTVREFHTVHEFNELLAWVLVFGRRPNHFTLSTHLMQDFSSLEDFHHFIEHDAGLPLNSEGGKIKGDHTKGIAQGSTVGSAQTVKLADGEVQLPVDFVEFVWRYPCDPACVNPARWDDYFTGFIANHANRVIESLY